MNFLIINIIFILNIFGISPKFRIFVKRTLSNKNENYEIYNVGTGLGYSILEIISTFEQIISRKIDVLQLGESEAIRLGVDVQNLKLKVVLFSATCVGASVALSGMIGFVGLVVPHLVRLIGGVNHSFLLAGSAILGAALMTSADLLSRILIQPAELPVGLLTSALGAPFFLWLIIKIKR